MYPENPSISEIEEWVYSNEEWPHSEWPLFLTWTGEIELFIKYATDHKCPKQTFFRFMLYYIVGFVFGYPQKPKSEVIREIELLISHGKGINHGDIRKWVKQSKALLQGEITYTYDDWRGGLLANYDFI